MLERISTGVASLTLLVIGALSWSALGLFFWGVPGAIGGAIIGGALAYFVSRPAIDD